MKTSPQRRPEKEKRLQKRETLPIFPFDENLFLPRSKRPPPLRLPPSACDTGTRGVPVRFAGPCGPGGFASEGHFGPRIAYPTGPLPKQGLNGKIGGIFFPVGSDHPEGEKSGNGSGAGFSQFGVLRAEKKKRRGEGGGYHPTFWKGLRLSQSPIEPERGRTGNPPGSNPLTLRDQILTPGAVKMTEGTRKWKQEA